MITTNHLRRDIECFETLCLTLYTKDVDIMAPDARAKQIRSNVLPTDPLAQTGFLAAVVMPDREPEPIDYICQLISTPRTLKHILRHCYSTWEHLHGEIDFHDLLVFSVLRLSVPEAFNFILTHYKELRGLHSDGVFRDRDERTELVEAKWSKIAENATWDAISAKALVQFLFYGWQNNQHVERRSAPIQGLQCSIPTDYLNRLILGEMPEGEVADQEVLAAIYKWMADPSAICFREKTLLGALNDDKRFSEVFGYFSSKLLTGNEYRSIASNLFSAVLQQMGSRANHESVCGFIPLWKEAVSKSIPVEEHHKWLAIQVKKSLSVSLRFANDIYNYWRSNSRTEIREKPSYKQSRSYIVDYAKTTFVNNPGLFVEVIDPTWMYSSYHFSFLFSLEKEGGSGFNPSEWKWFSELLLQAAQLDPQVVVPQIVCFLVKELHNPEGFTYSFDEIFANDFFGDNAEKLMTVLSSDISLEGFDEREVKRLQLAREKAVAWLDAHPKEELNNPESSIEENT